MKREKKMTKKSTILFFLALVTLLSVVFLYFYSSFGKSDMATADKNNNGIWDDYEFEIMEKYKDNPNIENAALQVGKALQIILSDLSNVAQKDKTFSKAMSCLVGAGLHDGLSIADATGQIEQVRDIVVSNEARQVRYIEYNVAVSGKMLPADMPDVGNCEFQIQDGSK